MLDAWFKNDLQIIFDTHPVAVFIDESSDAEFLLKTVENEFTVHQANSEVEELHIKYLIEKAQSTDEKFLVYTRSKKDDLKYIREYCETNGCLEIRYLQNYIKDKVHQTLNLNINFPTEELIAAAKVSVGKDHTYWMDLSHKGETEIFDLNKELLPFIHDPDAYVRERFDTQLQEIFYRKVNDLLGQDYFVKPAKTLAGEVVKVMFDGLAEGNCHKTLESVYISWLDSVSYRDSFNKYLNNYSILDHYDVWNINENHPFRKIDESWLLEIGEHIKDKNALPEYLTKIKQRQQSKQAQALGITFWLDVLTLLEFDPKDIAYLSSFTECVEYYTKHFCKLDTAIRNLYSEFLNKKYLLEPFQDLYKETTSIFLDKWFKYFSEYQENQTGVLQSIIDENVDNIEKIAIIVGDGVAYEIADQISGRVNNNFELTRKIIIADIPSVTENNMSHIYMANGVIESVHSNREKYLLEQNPSTTIVFVKLEEVNEESGPAQFLVCTYKDIDDIGEKLQQKALKYFPETIEFFTKKITQLLDSGYAKVYLITDHGFVLTGLLSEADKISISLEGVSDKSERYVRTEEKQTALTSNFVEIEKVYKQFNYLYFSQNMNPFKTPGVYGFSHGGLTPQEVITPYFCWEYPKEMTSSLSVSIDNKGDLKNITGDLFQLKIRSGKGNEDLYSMERKIYLVFFSNKEQTNKSDILNIKRDEVILKEYTFDGNSEIEVQLLDAQTKQQLDRAVIKQNQDRDLGGLL